MNNKNKLILIDCKRGCGCSFTSLHRTQWSMHEEVRKKYHGICAACLTAKERDELLSALIKQINILERYKNENRNS